MTATEQRVKEARTALGVALGWHILAEHNPARLAEEECFVAEYARAMTIAGQLKALDEVPLPRAYEDWLQDMHSLRAAIERGELVEEEPVSDSNRSSG